MIKYSKVLEFDTVFVMERTEPNRTTSFLSDVAPYRFFCAFLF